MKQPKQHPGLDGTKDDHHEYRQCQNSSHLFFLFVLVFHELHLFLLLLHIIPTFCLVNTTVKVVNSMVVGGEWDCFFLTNVQQTLNIEKMMVKACVMVYASPSSSALRQKIHFKVSKPCLLLTMHSKSKKDQKYLP